MMCPGRGPFAAVWPDRFVGPAHGLPSAGSGLQQGSARHPAGGAEVQVSGKGSHRLSDCRPPAYYSGKVNGRQYITVVATNTVLTFGLP